MELVLNYEVTQVSLRGVSWLTHSCLAILMGVVLVYEPLENNLGIKDTFT